MVAGFLAGTLLLAGYAYGAAELLWPSWLIEYLAVGLVLVSGVVTVLATAALLRWRKVHTRGAFMLGLLVALLLTTGLANAIRMYPPDQFGGQLPGYADWSPNLDTAIAAVRGHHFPALGTMLAGPELWALAGAEFLVLLILGMIVTGRALAAPYCHACRSWCQRSMGILQRAPVDREQAVQRVLARDWVYFRAVAEPGADDSSWLRFDTASCPECKRTNTLSVTRVRKWWRNKPIVEDMRLTEDDVRTVKSLSRTDHS